MLIDSYGFEVTPLSPGVNGFTATPLPGGVRVRFMAVPGAEFYGVSVFKDNDAGGTGTGPIAAASVTSGGFVTIDVLDLDAEHYTGVLEASTTDYDIQPAY